MNQLLVNQELTGLITGLIGGVQSKREVTTRWGGGKGVGDVTGRILLDASNRVRTRFSECLGFAIYFK